MAHRERKRRNESMPKRIMPRGTQENHRKYRICKNCVMDTSDSRIIFDSSGVCDFCRDYYDNILPDWKQGTEGEEELKRLSSEIRKIGRAHV